MNLDKPDLSLKTPTRGLQRENRSGEVSLQAPLRIGAKLNLAVVEEVVVKKNPPEPIKDSSWQGNGKRVVGKRIHSSDSGSNAKAWLFLTKMLFWP